MHLFEGCQKTFHTVFHQIMPQADSPSYVTCFITQSNELVISLPQTVDSEIQVSQVSLTKGSTFHGRFASLPTTGKLECYLLGSQMVVDENPVFFKDRLQEPQNLDNNWWKNDESCWNLKPLQYGKYMSDGSYLRIWKVVFGRTPVSQKHHI